MSCHRIDELLELLTPVWQQQNDLNLAQLLAKLAQEAGFNQPLEQLTDDVLIYHLKVGGLNQQEMIPGLAKDCEDDFQQALLRARGLID